MFACIIAVSLGCYLILFLGYQLPYTIIEWPYDNSSYFPFINYRLLLVPSKFYIFYRFQSIFTEPGHLGMVSSFLLYVNKYKIKKPDVCIILIGLLLTFSLAGYLLLFLGYCFYQIITFRKVLRKIIILIIVSVVLGCVGVYMYLNYPDHPITKLIISRLEYDEEKGIAGNNREVVSFDNYYSRNFIGSLDMIWGMSEKKFSEKVPGAVGVSYKGYFMYYGFFGILSLLLFYLSLVFSGKSRFVIGMFLLYAASFLQRSYYALWEIELFLFVIVVKGENKYNTYYK
jgi:hypothetical protein